MMITRSDIHTLFHISLIAACFIASPLACGQNLRVNFGVSPDSPLELSYQPYLALDRTNGSEDPVAGVDRTEAFAAFGGIVNLTVSYPDLQPGSEADEARVKRIVDRTGEEAARYLGTRSNLMRSWIGLDVRQSTANDAPTPTTLRLELGGVPADTYLLRTYHHDVRNQHGRFSIVTSDAGASNASLGRAFRITTSDSNVVNDAKADPGEGNGPELLRSTVEQVIVSDGINPITIDFQMVRESRPNQDFIFVLNGIELVATSDTDGDRIQDTDDPNPGEDDRALDDDGDGLSNFEELLRNLDPTSADSDGDGLADGAELENGVQAILAPGNLSLLSVNARSGEVTLEWISEFSTFWDRAAGQSVGVRGPSVVQASSDLSDWTETSEFSNRRPFTLTTPLADEPDVFFRLAAALAGFTSPWIWDTDGDGISDGDEINIHGSSPLDHNSDFDGFPDGHEVVAGANPTDTEDLPDRDGDGYSNRHETIAVTDPDNIDSYPTPDPALALFVDFNSNQDGGGDSSTDPDPSRSVAAVSQRGYQSYHANHEVAAEFTMATYSAFGTSVTLLPTWPNTTANRVQQSIDRSSFDDLHWVGNQIDLLTDWIGVDARTVNGGNGNYDGTDGTPTAINLTIGGLPAGTYDWISFHHDTEFVWSDFVVQIDTGSGFVPVLGPFTMTSTSRVPRGSENIHRGYPTDGTIDPVDLPSTFKTTFAATGADVTVRFTPLPDSVSPYRSLLGINGFQLTKSP